MSWSIQNSSPVSFIIQKLCWSPISAIIFLLDLSDWSLIMVTSSRFWTWLVTNTHLITNIRHKHRLNPVQFLIWTPGRFMRLCIYSSQNTSRNLIFLFRALHLYISWSFKQFFFSGNHLVSVDDYHLSFSMSSRVQMQNERIRNHSNTTYINERRNTSCYEIFTFYFHY